MLLSGPLAWGGANRLGSTADDTDDAISAFSTIHSLIKVSNRSGSASRSTQGTVGTANTDKCDLIAPDGSAYVLHDRSSGSATDTNTTHRVTLSSEALSGTWTLRVDDNDRGGDAGRLNG